MKEYFNALRKYNFWDANVPELSFIRANYMNKIMDYTGVPDEY
jgi:hypothetical protein